MDKYATEKYTLLDDLLISITNVYSNNLSRAKVHLVIGPLWSIADYVFISRSLFQIMKVS